MRRLSRGSLKRLGRVLRPCSVALALSSVCGVAEAHHAPGHGASEGIRTLNSAGPRTPRATQRLLLLGEVTHATPEPNLNAATMYTASVLGSFMPHPWLSVGAQAPLTFVDEATPGVPTKRGYGDTRFELRLTPHGDKLMHRVLTVGVNASVPTRTVRFEVDPGPLWSIAPLIGFSRTFASWSWNVLLLTPIDHRPAGTALEVSGALLGAWELLPGWQLTGGGLVDVRAATRCALPGSGSEWCREGRATERNREVGATRAYASLGTALELDERWTVSAGFQLPVTARRDFDGAANVGLEVRF